MAENINSYVLDCYHAADRIKAGSPEFNPGESLSGFLNAGKMAAEVGMLNPEQATQYRQGALAEVGKYYFNAKTSRKFIKDFEAAAGKSPAREALLDAFFTRTLRRQNRKTIVDQLEDNQAAVKAFIPEQLNQVDKKEKKLLLNLAKAGVFSDWVKVNQIARSAVRKEAGHRGIGTDIEQMRHLFSNWLRELPTIAPSLVIPIIISVPLWWPATYIETANTSQLTDPKLLTKTALFGLSGIAGGLIQGHELLKETRDIFVAATKSFTNDLGAYVKNGKAPGTPKV